jgi:hypothetical protein
MARLEAALTAINDSLVNANESQQLIGAKCRALIVGYEARWGHLEYKVTAVENFVSSDLWNPETQGKSRSYRIGGKMDASTFDGASTIIDHKSTKEDIEHADAPYWRNLVVEAQVSHYWLLEHLNGRKPESAVWDVMRKPSISPKQVTKADQKFVTISHQYCGRPISDDSILEMQQAGRETLEMYEVRLIQDCVDERPQRYFQRRTIPRLDAEIAEYACDIWDTAKAMLYTRQQARTTGRLPRRHSGACFSYGRPCTYLGICSGFDSPDSGKWQIKKNVHSELPMIEGDGRDLLTVSRIKMYELCPRKEHYSYEVGIERLEEEEVESLYFGTLWHKGLEAWWGYGISTEQVGLFDQQERKEACQLQA